MKYDFLKYEKDERIARITIDRPERLNALHPPANDEMLSAFTSFRDDPDMLVAIVTGAGDRAFSAGNDLRYTAEHGRMQSSMDQAPFGGITSDFTCWKPIIAAVNGYAMGGGLELALACDIVVAADHAELALPEVTVGLIAGAGGVHRLPRLIPPKIAMGMMLTGRRLSAGEAHQFGLVNEVVALDDLQATAEEWAHDIIKVAPLSARATKQMATTGLAWPVDVALRKTYSEHQRAMASDDWIEGPRAFSEKREPNWTGA